MNLYPSWPGAFILVASVALYALFLVSSAFEKEWRALRVGLLLLPLPVLLFAGYFLLPSPARSAASLIMTGIALLLLIRLVIPARIEPPDEIAGEVKRVDERDVIFSRRRLEPGTEAYEKYYRERPDLKGIDDDIRRRPPLFAPGGRFYDPKLARMAAKHFEILEELAPSFEGPIAPDKVEIDPEEAARFIKERIIALGARHVGIGRLDPAFLYTHTGRGLGGWGEKVEVAHKTAVSFTLEMDYDAVRRGPRLETTVETGRRYVQGAEIGIVVADLIRSLGYDARPHMEGSSYLAILPPLAARAGLGEVGRIGILMNEELGPRCRLGLVTTDMPLAADAPAPFGASLFCEKGRKCADACPSGAIPKGGKVPWNGTGKWKLKPEACYKAWREFGSDCAVCVLVCPYSKPDTPIHRLVRLAVKRSGLARRLALLADDLFYGTAGDFLKKRKLNG